MSQNSIFSTLVLAVIAIQGCAVTAIPEAPKSEKNAIVQVSYKPITSQDGKVQISLPDGWVDAWKPNNPGKYSLKVADHANDLYLAINTRTKVPGLKLAQMAEIGTKGAKAAMENARMERTPVNKVGNYSAVQYKLQGKKMGIDLVILMTAIETPTQIHFMMIGGSQDSFHQQQSELNRMVQSFKEVKNTASAK